MCPRMNIFLRSTTAGDCELGENAGHFWFNIRYISASGRKIVRLEDKIISTLIETWHARGWNRERIQPGANLWAGQMIGKPNRQKELRKRPRKRPMSGLKFWYLGDGQTMDRPSWVHVAVKRGTLLSGQTKEWGFAKELPVDLLEESWVMDALIFFTLVCNTMIPFGCWWGCYLS